MYPERGEKRLQGHQWEKHEVKNSSNKAGKEETDLDFSEWSSQNTS